MIKLIKITIKYIKWAHTTDRHNPIIGILFLQSGEDLGNCPRYAQYSKVERETIGQTTAQSAF